MGRIRVRVLKFRTGSGILKFQVRIWIRFSGSGRIRIKLPGLEVAMKSNFNLATSPTFHLRTSPDGKSQY